MKQIGNWVFGSFFRTIGRLLVFILLGIVIANIIDFGSIKDNFRITDLFFDRVDALSLDGTPRYQQQYHNTQVLLQDAYDTTHTIQVNFDTPFNSNADYAIFSIKGVQWYSAEDGQYGDPDNPTVYRDMVLKQFLNIQLKSTSGPWAACEIQDSYLVCGINENITYNGFAVQADSLAITQGYSMKLNNYVWFYDKDSTSLENAIDSQTQQQQQNHEETQSYLEDSNTTQAEEEASSFFEDFDAPDIGGLGAIITAPLNTIRSLLNSSCTNLTLPLPFVNQNLNLPCMNTIYTEHFGAFFSIYQTIILAIIAYRCIRSIFFDIHGFTNPNDDRIEVMDL